MTGSRRGRMWVVVIGLVGLGLLFATVVAAIATHDRPPAGGSSATTGAGQRFGYRPGDAFYDLPGPLAAAAPGTIIEQEPIAAPAGARGWKLLYHSRAPDGRDIAVSGVVYVPTGAAPAGGRDVVSYAHGTAGVADRCAPSRAADPSAGIPALEARLRAGYIVAATDYEGLGVAGVHPYLVGVSEGRGVLDIARASRRLPGAHASSRVVVDGHSQGGHAALFAGEIAAGYAEDLDVRGVSAGAPVTDVAAFLDSSRAIPGFRGFPMLAAAGYHAVYPHAPLGALFSAAAIGRIAVAEQVCDLNAVFGASDAPILIADPSTTAPWAGLFRRNSPGYARTSIPILVWQGDADPIVPAAATAQYVRRACTLGDTVTERVYAGADHGSVLTRARADIERWIAARFAGTPVATGCSAIQHSSRT